MAFGPRTGEECYGSTRTAYVGTLGAVGGAILEGAGEHFPLIGVVGNLMKNVGGAAVLYELGRFATFCMAEVQE